MSDNGETTGAVLPKINVHYLKIGIITPGNISTLDLKLFLYICLNQSYIKLYTREMAIVIGHVVYTWEN